MKKYTASISDADILRHLLQTNNLIIIENLFDEVIIPAYILEHEIRNNDYLAYEKIHEILKTPNTIFKLVDRKKDYVINGIARTIIEDTKKYVGPGESEAAGYAVALKIPVIISDNSTEFKYLEDQYIMLAYYELLALNVHFKLMDIAEATGRYDSINGILGNSSSADFRSRQNRAYKRFTAKGWDSYLQI